MISLKVVVITHNYIRREGDLTALYLHRLSAGLVGKGVEMVVVCPYAPGLLRTDTIDGVRIVRFDYPFSRTKPLAYTGNMHQEVAGSFFAKIVFLFFLWSFYRVAVKIYRAEKPDLIWANWWIPPGLVAARIASRYSVPLIVSSHGTDISLLGKSGIIGRLSRYVYRRTAKATVVSQYLKDKLLAGVAEFPKDNAMVIPMPVGMEHFPKTPLPAGMMPLFLSVARYTRQKRLDLILCAAEKLIAQKLPFKILMVGEGPLESELREMTKAKRLSDHIQFIPLVAQQKLGELYRQSDAVLLVSEGEGFGLVLVEAGLTGRPVIGARSGGIVDIVEDGVNGFMIEPGDVDALAKYMQIIISDKERKAALGEGGYKRAIDRFSTPVLVGRVYDLFVKTMKTHRVRHAS